MSLIRTSPPAALPAALAELRGDRRIADEDVGEDALLLGFLAAATERAEEITGRALISQQWELKVDRFPPERTGKIVLPRPRLISVDSIAYVDTDGNTQTLSSSVYQAVGIGNDWRAHIVEAYGQSWPATREQPEAVTVAFTAGYGTSWNDVPEIIRLAILRMAGTWYEHREDASIGPAVHSVPWASETLLAGYRVIPF